MSLGLAGLVGCSGEPESVTKEKTVAAAGLCGGAVSADAAKALQLISGAEKFEPTGKDSTTVNAVQKLIDNFSPLSEKPSMVPEDLCRIYPGDESNHEEIRIQFHLVYGKLAETGGDLASGLRAFRMGEKASAGSDRSFLQFACTSDKLTGSSESPAHVEVLISQRKAPEGDTEELRSAQAALVHSVSLSMARESGCADDGGLEERPALKPE
ncbi:hypothetical protein AB0L71_29560 [Streptomyces sp. NPDC052052]|uniref:hypothetical protein n=1 Tax=Streptomyces sp. NPDC052052 TaxID=3154756 RepID=UPI00343F4DF0